MVRFGMAGGRGPPVLLDVPLVRQTENSGDCGIMALEMLLEYYGVGVSIEVFRRELGPGVGGYCTGQLGSYLLRQGFAVEAVSLHPSLFTNGDKGKTPAEVLAHLRHYRDCGRIADSRELRHLITFLEDGGGFQVKIPDAEDIRREITAGRPLLTVLSANWLRGTEPENYMHFNTITGIDDAHIYVNDPLWDARGGRQAYPIADYLYAIYVGTLSNGDADNGCLLKAQRV